MFLLVILVVPISVTTMMSVKPKGAVLSNVDIRTEPPGYLLRKEQNAAASERLFEENTEETTISPQLIEN